MVVTARENDPRCAARPVTTTTAPSAASARECGAALAAVCAACGASNEPGEKFCGGCGARLPTAAPAIAAATPAREPEAALPAGERRQLTVLFCDLVGSTPLSQQLDAEEWRDLVAQYQQAAAGAVARFGGHVAKNLGDGLLIYFGWPTAREDDPERAVRAGPRDRWTRWRRSTPPSPPATGRASPCASACTPGRS